jgi:hypothetical protein
MKAMAALLTVILAGAEIPTTLCILMTATMLTKLVATVVVET